MAGEIFNDINPTVTSGTDLANILNLFKDAYRSNLKGTSRPTNIAAGGFWIDSTLEAGPDYLLVLKMYDGADDITLLTVNINTNTISVDQANATFTILKVSADAVGPILKLFKNRIASSGQTLISDVLGKVQWIGMDNTGLATTISEISSVALNNTTATQSGGYLVFKTTDFNSASMVEKMRLYNGLLGVGETNPLGMVHATGATGIIAQSAVADDALPGIFTTLKKRIASSGKVLINDVIGKFRSNSTDEAGTVISDAATIEAIATEAHTSTAQGTSWNFYVKKIGAITKTLQMTIGDTITFVPAVAYTALATFNAHLKLYDLSSKYVTLKSYASMVANWDFVFPADAGTTGYALTVKSGGGTEWSNITLPTDTRNDLVNSTFFNWQRGTLVTATNGQKKYCADHWYVKNSLGVNGQIQNSLAGATKDGAYAANKLLISTAPTSSQANGCELYYVFENLDSLKYYNKTASMSCWVKAFGNVNQVGIQFFYATSEVALTTAIGSETTFTVNTATATYGEKLAQAIGTAQTTFGVIGIRIRITGVSSGNTYDLNNGFQVELPVVNLGSQAMTHQPYKNVQEETQICLRRYNPFFIVPNLVCAVSTQLYGNAYLPVSMRASGVNATYTLSSPVSASKGTAIVTQSTTSGGISVTGSSNTHRVDVILFNFTGATPDAPYSWSSTGGYLTIDADIY